MDSAKACKGITSGEKQVLPARLFYGTEIYDIKYPAYQHSSVNCWREKIRHNLSWEKMNLESNWRPGNLGQWKKDTMAPKMKSWGCRVTSAGLSDLREWNAISQLTFYWNACSQPENCDEYPLDRFLTTSNVKAFPKFQMTTELVVFPGEPCSGRCRRLTFLPAGTNIEAGCQNKRRQETVENWEKERVEGGRWADACDLCLEQRGISAADNLIRLKA